MPVQGGSDWLAAFAADGKAENKIKQQVAELQLTDVQAVTARALYKLKGVGPTESCLVAKQYGSLAGLMRHFLSQPAVQACKQIAELRRASGRKVGPAAADKLRIFCTGEDPDAIFADAE